MSLRRQPALGGPGTFLPRPIESVLAWSLCVSCLSVSGYHHCVSNVVGPAWNRWRRFARTVLAELLGGGRRKRLDGDDAEPDDDDEEGALPPFRRAWIPLMTCSRSELDRYEPRRRLEQLSAALGRVLGRETTTTTTTTPPWDDVDDGELIRAIRSDEACRRLASLAMRPPRRSADGAAATTTTLLPEDAPEPDLSWRLARIWPELLALPPPSFSSRDGYDISLVVPAFRESGVDLGRKLGRALRSCVRPERVEVILVDAGGCTDLGAAVRDRRTSPSGDNSGGGDDASPSGGRWGRVRRVEFTSSGGRGPCLNFGAERAAGRVLTFCHSDTALPECWDAAILDTLFPPTEGEGDRGLVRANACAFNFGIDTTSSGLNGGPYPPGIRAVETTANLRTRLYALPYGDQCLSVPADIFRHLGGFPDQCLFEDYELVALLRRRAALLPLLGARERERLAIVPGPPALCSPRRWQKFGALYVTYVNSRLVNLYAGGESPDEVFRLYYGADPPKRDREESPWEVRTMSAGII